MSTELKVEIMSTSIEVIPNEVMSSAASGEQLTKKQLKRIEYEKKVSENIIKNNAKVAACINDFVEKFLLSDNSTPLISESMISRWKSEALQTSLIETIQANKLKSKLKSEEEVQHNIEKNTKKQEKLLKKKQKTQERIEKLKQKRIEKNLSKCKKNLPPGTAPTVSKYDKNKVKKTPVQQASFAPQRFATPQTTQVVQPQPVKSKLSPDARPFLVRTNTEPRFKKYTNA